MVKDILKLKEKDKATFFSPSDVWCLPAPSLIKPQERYFVVDSGASRHNRKDLNSNELETVRVSRNPTTVITANGEMQTNEEAAVYVNDLDLIRDGPDPRGLRPQVYRLEKSAKITDVLICGLVVKNHMLFEKAGRYSATRKTLCFSLFEACPLDRPALPRVRPQHLYHRTQCEMILRQIQQTHEVEVNAAGRWKTSCQIRKKPKKKKNND